jgi:hypothetical protein
MRAYVPVTLAQLDRLQHAGQLTGPVRGCAVDPGWRSGDPAVDEEQWEFEAQSLAAEALPGGQGVVLAVDVADEPARADGWCELAGPIRREDLAAVLTADLAWFAVQEIPDLLGS